MDLRRSITKTLQYINLRKDRTGQNNSRPDNGGQDRKSTRHVTTIPVAVAISQATIDNALMLFDDARKVHKTDPLNGHKVADEILLELIGNADITKAFRKCC